MYILLEHYAFDSVLNLDESRIKMIFSCHPYENEFQLAEHGELVWKRANCISTVVADYILHQSPQNLSDDTMQSLSLLYGECITL